MNKILRNSKKEHAVEVLIEDVNRLNLVCCFKVKTKIILKINIRYRDILFKILNKYNSNES